MLCSIGKEVTANSGPVKLSFLEGHAPKMESRPAWSSHRTESAQQSQSGSRTVAVTCQSSYCRV